MTRKQILEEQEQEEKEEAKQKEEEEMEENRYCHCIPVDYDDGEKEVTFYLNCQNKVHRYKTRVKKIW